MAEFAQAPATLVLDDVVRVYISTRPPRDAQGQYVSYTGWVDLDRSNLTSVVRVALEPILPLGGLGAFDEFGTYPVSVIRDDDGLVRAYYGGWTRCESVPYDVAIGLATSSDDGVSFTPRGVGPLLARSLTEPMTISGPKVRRFDGQWHLWYVAGTKWKVVDGRPESVFKIRHATSADGITWDRSGETVIPDVLEADECQASPDVFRLGDRYHMLFSAKYSWGFRNGDRGYRLGYAWSADLVHWERDDAHAGLEPAGGDEWDGQALAYPHVFDVDGRVYMAYLGNDVGRDGFGLAELDQHVADAR